MSHAARKLQPQVSATLRFAAAAGVCALLALTWTMAEHASSQAVQTDIAAFTSGPAQGASQAVQTAALPAASALAAAEAAADVSHERRATER